MIKSLINLNFSPVIYFMKPSTSELARKQASLCKAVGNDRRLEILWMIAGEELPVNEIAQRVGSSMQNVSQHLKLLRKCGIVTTRRDGQTIYYRLADNEFVRQCYALLHIPDSKIQTQNPGS